jgi:hypothetical protein
MNEQFVLEFIRQRMQQLGVCSYHYEAMFLFAQKARQEFNLSNEIWYMVGRPLNISITSDTAIYHYTTLKLVSINPPEFTGRVSIISNLDNQPLALIKVIIQKA